MFGVVVSDRTHLWRMSRRGRARWMTTSCILSCVNHRLVAALASNLETAISDYDRVTWLCRDGSDTLHTDVTAIADVGQRLPSAQGVCPRVRWVLIDDFTADLVVIFQIEGNRWYRQRHTSHEGD